MSCPSGGGVGGSTINESGSCLLYNNAVTGLGRGEELADLDAPEGGGGVGRFHVVENSTGGGMATYLVLYAYILFSCAVSWYSGITTI